MLDAQAAGCIPEYENMRIPKCHALYDPDCRSDRVIPFLRSRYDFGTGYNPNNPRMQLNEITPWFDGGLMYGITKAWADALRSYSGGELAALDNSRPIAEQFPISNTIGLPLANPAPPVNHSNLYAVNRFWSECLECEQYLQLHYFHVYKGLAHLLFLYRDWQPSWR